MCLIIGKLNGFIEERSENKDFVSIIDENKEVLKNCTELWDEIKNEIKIINGGKEGQYGKDFLKTKFDTDDDLLLNKLLKFPTMTIVVRSVFEDDGKFYPQIF